MRRPVTGEPRADDALRVRSARVALGLTIGALGMVHAANNGDHIGFAPVVLVALAGLVGWIATVQRPRRVHPVASGT